MLQRSQIRMKTYPSAMPPFQQQKIDSQKTVKSKRLSFPVLSIFP